MCCIISGMTFTCYALQDNTRYGRLLFEVISNSGIADLNGTFNLHNSNTAESTLSSGTLSVDLGSVNNANSATNSTYASNLGTSSGSYSYTSLQGALNGKADAATTLSGYGITDAKISNGTITLGSNTLKPLTSHQSLSGYATEQ